MREIERRSIILPDGEITLRWTETERRPRKLPDMYYGEASDTRLDLPLDKLTGVKEIEFRLLVPQDEMYIFIRR